VFATGRARAFPVKLGAGFGATVGNRPAALPPGLRLGLADGATGTAGRVEPAERPGKLLTGSGEVNGTWSDPAVPWLVAEA
jgi:hypothetical protein